MSAIWVSLIGGFGNALFQYSAARAIAERDGLELRTPEWAGEKIFLLPPVNRERRGAHILGGYRQNQASAIYTRAQIKEWFKFKPEIEEMLEKGVPKLKNLAHTRDYGDAPYLSTISSQSYQKGILKFGFEIDNFSSIAQSHPFVLKGCEQFDFLPDFYTLMKADVLFRANSTFSMWAAWLGNGKVYSPVMDGKPGGKVVDVEFVEGNHPKCCEYPDVGDITLKP